MECVLRHPQHGDQLAAELAELRHSGLFADVNLVCSDGNLLSHKPLLAAVSPLLHDLLSLNQVLDEASATTLLLPDFRLEHLRLALDYVYFGYLKASETKHVDEVMEVLRIEGRRRLESDWVPVSNEERTATLNPKVSADSRQGFVASEENYSERTRNYGAVVEVGPDSSDDSDEEGATSQEIVETVDDDDSNDGYDSKNRVGLSADGGNGLDAGGSEECTRSGDSGGQSSTSGSSAKGPSVKCVMCGKEFRHQANLRVHIQSHLGIKVQLKSCDACDRNFRSSLEYDLHMRSHVYSRFLARRRLAFSKAAGKNGSKIRTSKGWLLWKCKNAARVNLLRKSLQILRSGHRRGNLLAKFRRLMEARLEAQVQRQKARADKERLALEKERQRQLQRSSTLAATTPNDSLTVLPSGKVRLKLKVDPAKLQQLSRSFSNNSPVATASPSAAAPPQANVSEANNHAAAAAKDEVMFFCRLCPSSFKLKKNYVRHARNQHRLDTNSAEFQRHLRAAADSHPSSGSSTAVNRQRPVKSSSKTAPRRIPAIKVDPPVSKRRLSSQSGGPSSTPAKRARTASSASNPAANRSKCGPSKRQSAELDLTCPTCDKVFLAKSIFERHLKTYKHGEFGGAAATVEGPQLSETQPPRQVLPHLNQVLQPTMQLGGREVNKYECHLCNQVFLRVKDLAKHRAKMCTAWMNR